MKVYQIVPSAATSSNRNACRAGVIFGERILIFQAHKRFGGLARIASLQVIRQGIAQIERLRLLSAEFKIRVKWSLQPEFHVIVTQASSCESIYLEKRMDRRLWFHWIKYPVCSTQGLFKKYSQHDFKIDTARFN